MIGVTKHKIFNFIFNQDYLFSERDSLVQTKNYLKTSAGLLW